VLKPGKSTPPHVDLNNPARSQETEVLPTLAELGLTLSVRRQIESDVADHAELGTIRKQAEKDQQVITDRLKKTIPEHISTDETPKFYASAYRVCLKPQTRRSFDQAVAKAALLAAGVKPAVVKHAFDTATTVNEFMTLRITAPGEEE